ncbi:MAG TPA: hypothetical protein VIM30_13050 [Candidatus Limnocylindrales bacterium]
MVQFHIGSRRFDLTRNEVEDAVRGLLPDVIQSLAVYVDGRWWPVKQPFVAALKLRNTDVNSRTALRYLERLGFEVHDTVTQGPLPVAPEGKSALRPTEDIRLALTLAVELLKGGTTDVTQVIGIADQFAAWLGEATKSTPPKPAS